jgi:hypothetical protein
MHSTNCLGMPRLSFSGFVHNRLSNMYHKFKIGETDMWHSRTSSAGMYQTWEPAITLQDKLYEDAENLELTTNFLKLIIVNEC